MIVQPENLVLGLVSAHDGGKPRGAAVTSKASNTTRVHIKASYNTCVEATDHQFSV
jgi:hypothetical protein